MKCHFCKKPCHSTATDSNGNLYNCCLKCKVEKKLNISVVYKKGAKDDHNNS